MFTPREKIREPKLNQELRGFQIFFIVLSTVIGGGIFNDDGQALEVAGPAGLLVAVAVMGITGICLGESLGEMTQQFPVYNAIVEYVRVFVDEELGWVVGIAYWYSFASVFAVQNLVAAGLASYWGVLKIWQSLICFLLTPLILAMINWCGVFWYGWVETVGGFLKVCLVLGTSLLLYVIAGDDRLAGVHGSFGDGFTNNPEFSSNHAQAVCYAIPIVAYSFIGIEVIAITAYEARSPKDLRWPSQVLPWVTFFLYLFCSIAEAVVIKWTNSDLPSVYGGSVGDWNTPAPVQPDSNSMVVIAAWQAGWAKTASFVNACLIFSVVSQANSSLYAASRTMYGMTREMPKTNWFLKKLRFLSLVERFTHVPVWALVVTALSFIWLPFLSFPTGFAIADVINIIVTIGSAAALIVWAALCLAYIQYHRYLNKYDNELPPQYRRESSEYKPRTALMAAQPAVAWLGFIGCILFFVFCSTTWWTTPPTFSKVALAYGAQFFCFALVILLKLFSGTLFKPWGTRFTNDAHFIRELDRLKARKIKDRVRMGCNGVTENGEELRQL